MKKVLNMMNFGDTLKVVAMLLAASTSQVVWAQACVSNDTASVYGMGVIAPASPLPVLAAREAQIVAKGDRSRDLQAMTVPAVDLTGMTLDYALMRLTMAAGHPLLVMTDDGGPGPVVTGPMPSGSLLDVIEGTARSMSMRWRYDGDKIWLFKANDWKVGLPDQRDLNIAAQAAVASIAPSNLRFAGSEMTFSGDMEAAQKVSTTLASLYAQGRLNPHDVTFYKVYPSKGKIAWEGLADRTEAVEMISFDGKGASLVLDATAGAVIDTFLGLEGRVIRAGNVTMVSPELNGTVSRQLGCGEQASSARTLSLSAGAYDGGKVQLSYEVQGGGEIQQGRFSAAPGSVIVIADGQPEEGAYTVAVVRTRVLEMQGPVTTPAAQPAVYRAPAQSEVPPMRTVDVPKPVVETTSAYMPLGLTSAASLNASILRSMNVGSAGISQ